jgi:hypothetical protein
MKEYKYQGETFQIDDSGCDGSGKWEMKVTDGNNTAVITPHITKDWRYMAEIPGGERGNTDSPEGALNVACNLLIRSRPVDLPTPEDVGKLLCEFVDKL